MKRPDNKEAFWPRGATGWAGTTWALGYEKHARYLQEAERARQLGTISWRAALATSLRRAADRLEPLQPVNELIPAMAGTHSQKVEELSHERN